ncbi:Polysaccharide biosynthesis protein [compost metagenome]
MSAGISVIAAGASFITNIIVARFYGLEDYAYFSYVISLTSITSMISTLGLNQYLLLNLPGKNASIKSSIQQKACSTFYVSNILISIVLLCFLLSNGSSINESLFICMISILSSCFIFRQGVYFSEEKIILSQLIDRVVRALFLIMLLISFKLFSIEESSFIVSLSIILSYLCASVIYLFLIKDVRVFYFNSSGLMEASEVKSSLMLCAVVISTTLLSNFDIIFLGFVKNSFDLSVYASSQKISLMGAIFLLSITNVVTPSLVKGKDKDLKSSLMHATSIGFFASLLFFVFVLIFGEFVLSIFGNEFKAGYNTLVILALSQLVSSFFGQSLTMMKVKGEIKTLSIFILIALLFKASLISYFYQMWGINGVAMSTLISVFVWNYLCFRYLNKNYSLDTSLRNIFR